MRGKRTVYLDHRLSSGNSNDVRNQIFDGGKKVYELNIKDDLELAFYSEVQALSGITQTNV